MARSLDCSTPREAAVEARCRARIGNTLRSGGTALQQVALRKASKLSCPMLERHGGLGIEIYNPARCATFLPSLP